MKQYIQFPFYGLRFLADNLYKSWLFHILLLVLLYLFYCEATCFYGQDDTFISRVRSNWELGWKTNWNSCGWLHSLWKVAPIFHNCYNRLTFRCLLLLLSSSLCNFQFSLVWKTQHRPNNIIRHLMSCFDLVI